MMNMARLGFLLAFLGLIYGKLLLLYLLGPDLYWQSGDAHISISALKVDVIFLNIAFT